MAGFGKGFYHGIPRYQESEPGAFATGFRQGFFPAMQLGQQYIQMKQQAKREEAANDFKLLDYAFQLMDPDMPMAYRARGAKIFQQIGPKHGMDIDFKAADQMEMAKYKKFYKAVDIYFKKAKDLEWDQSTVLAGFNSLVSEYGLGPKATDRMMKQYGPAIEAMGRERTEKIGERAGMKELGYTPSVLPDEVPAEGFEGPVQTVAPPEDVRVGPRTGGTYLKREDVGIAEREKLSALERELKLRMGFDIKKQAAQLAAKRALTGEDKYKFDTSVDDIRAYYNDIIKNEMQFYGSVDGLGAFRFHDGMEEKWLTRLRELQADLRKDLYNASVGRLPSYISGVPVEEAKARHEQQAAKFLKGF